MLNNCGFAGKRTKIGEHVAEMLLNYFRCNTKKKNPMMPVGDGNPKWPPIIQQNI